MFIRGIDIPNNTSLKPNITENITDKLNFVTYYVVHDGEPYRLDYLANVKDFQKYLPQFEQMVRSFKFAK